MQSIALVNCCLPSSDKNLFGAPQGVLSIATYLRKYEYEVKIFDMNIDLEPIDATPDSFFNYLNKIEENVIGISIWDSVLPKIILALKKLSDIKPEKVIILGGPAASSLGKKLIYNFNYIDYVVLGACRPT